MKKSFGSFVWKSDRGVAGLFVMSAILVAGTANTALAGDGPLRPIAECVIRQGDTWLALWGYENTTGNTIDQGIGTGNEFVTPPQDRGQPILFFPGLHECVFWTQQPAETSLTWRLCAPQEGCASAIAGPNTPECTGDHVPLARVSSTSKGSLLIFSKVEIKWSADGSTLLQDTFLDFSNDYPQNVDIQAYFINGDVALEELRDDETGAVIQTFEPGWNTADCRFKLTAGQPHYWSAATGSDKCQAFSVLDGQGPGRPDPETLGGNRILRGYVVMWAVDFDSERNLWAEIRWNHLKGDAVIVNFTNGTAWEYNAWAFQAGCAGHGEFTGTPGVLLLNGVEYSKPFSQLLLDFYKPGSLVFSNDEVRTIQVQTDLTLHPVSVDLRQDNFGPVLTKVDANVCNEFESCNSGGRRCICCWDQTMLDVWSNNIPGAINTFRTLSTDKGKALLEAGESTDCNFEDHCGDVGRRPLLLEETRRIGIRVRDDGPDPVLGLATKFLSFTGGGPTLQASAGMNLVGSGGDALSTNDPSAFILYDIPHGSEELRNDTNRDDVNRPGSVSKPAVPSDRQTTLRTEVDPVPAE